MALGNKKNPSFDSGRACSETNICVIIAVEYLDLVLFFSMLAGGSRKNVNTFLE